MSRVVSREAVRLIYTRLSILGEGLERDAKFFNTMSMAGVWKEEAREHFYQTLLERATTVKELAESIRKMLL
jgi:hypothetical protein